MSGAAVICLSVIVGWPTLYGSLTRYTSITRWLCAFASIFRLQPFRFISGRWVPIHEIWEEISTQLGHSSGALKSTKLEFVTEFVGTAQNSCITSTMLCYQKIKGSDLDLERRQHISTSRFLGWYSVDSLSQVSLGSACWYSLKCYQQERVRLTLSGINEFIYI